MTTLSGVRDESTGINYIHLDEYILYLSRCEDDARDEGGSFNTIAAEVYRDLRKALMTYRDGISGKTV